MIVVSDTSPLNYLVLIDEIGILPRLFEQVYVPPSVIEELLRLKTPEVVRRWAASPPAWLTIMVPGSQLSSTASLGDGEADALALAKELGIRDILIDDRRGRRIAEREGLAPLPLLAVLERAAAEHLLELNHAINKLQQTNIRVTQELVRAALERDAARKRG